MFHGEFDGGLESDGYDGDMTPPAETDAQAAAADSGPGGRNVRDTMAYLKQRIAEATAAAFRAYTAGDMSGYFLHEGRATGYASAVRMMENSLRLDEWAAR